MSKIRRSSRKQMSSRNTTTPVGSKSSDSTEAVKVKKLKLVSTTKNKACDSKDLHKRAGEVVWAKFGSTKWWPAMVVENTDCCQKPAKPEHTWVYWFGDYRVSEVSSKNLSSIEDNYDKKAKTCTAEKSRKGLQECKQLLEEREKIFAETGEKIFDLPSSVKKNLDIFSFGKQDSDSESENGIEVSDSSDDEAEPIQLKQSFAKVSASSKVWGHVADINDVCIACDDYDKNVEMYHPLFVGGLCSECAKNIKFTMFARGVDGKNLYCSYCGQLGDLYVCDNSKCSGCFCHTCIRLWAAPGTSEKLEYLSPWTCFFCSEFDSKLNGFIQQEKTWDVQIRNLFQHETSNPIRVLSLFDGIGTDGTGVLVKEFIRVLKMVKAGNSSMGKKAYFLFENVASMSSSNRDEITSYFEIEPVYIDARYFSAQNRVRLFWSNIPGIHAAKKYWEKLMKEDPLPTHYKDKRILLDDYLNKKQGRTALVSKIRTVTTHSNSLKQKETDSPVLMDTKKDKLWITEVEPVFGFPVHYTDVGNFSNSKRIMLIGKSWCIDVVKYILSPLKYFFKMKTSNEDSCNTNMFH